MIKLWFAPRTRSVRVRWLLEELGLPHELKRGYPAVRSLAIFGKLFPDFTPRYVELSMQIVSRQLAVPIGNQTRIGWEDTLKTLSALRLLARAVSAEEVAIYD